jgi:hypothetical protein
MQDINKNQNTEKAEISKQSINTGVKIISLIAIFGISFYVSKDLVTAGFFTLIIFVFLFIFG